MRATMIDYLQKRFPDMHFVYLIGGQSSFDVFPEVSEAGVANKQGMDKTYCLQFLKDYDEIYFFGDKIHPVACNEWSSRIGWK